VKPFRFHAILQPQAHNETVKSEVTTLLAVEAPGVIEEDKPGNRKSPVLQYGGAKYRKIINGWIHNLTI